MEKGKFIVFEGIDENQIEKYRPKKWSKCSYPT